jgi:hypothetical protein
MRGQGQRDTAREVEVYGGDGVGERDGLLVNVVGWWVGCFRFPSVSGARIIDQPSNQPSNQPTKQATRPSKQQDQPTRPTKQPTNQASNKTKQPTRTTTEQVEATNPLTNHQHARMPRGLLVPRASKSCYVQLSQTLASQILPKYAGGGARVGEILVLKLEWKHAQSAGKLFVAWNPQAIAQDLEQKYLFGEAKSFLVINYELARGYGIREDTFVDVTLEAPPPLLKMICVEPVGCGNESWVGLGWVGLILWNGMEWNGMEWIGYTRR